jgi:hypothetical protein
MKKIFLFLGFLLFAVAMNAQSGATTKMLATKNTVNYSPVASDTVGGTATKYWVFQIDRPEINYYISTVRFNQKLTGGRTVGNHVTLTLSGSIDGVGYITIDTALVHPSATHNQGEGKTLNWTYDFTTGTLYNYLKVTAVGGDANKGSTLTELGIKIGKK